MLPHARQLEKLDSEYEKKDHPMLDGYRMVGAGGVGNPWSEDQCESKNATLEGKEACSDIFAVREGDIPWGLDPPLSDDGAEGVKQKKAFRKLEDHIKDRLPYAMLASTRLQAVMGLRNELQFGMCCVFLLSTMCSGFVLGVRVRTQLFCPFFFFLC